jgi:hypothetical protein
VNLLPASPRRRARPHADCTREDPRILGAPARSGGRGGGSAKPWTRHCGGVRTTAGRSRRA